MSKLSELCKVNPHVKFYKFSISYSSCSFHLSQCFYLVIFARKNILVYQCETVRKHQQGRAMIFFSYYEVKVGEFMKLSYACEEIVSGGFPRY